MNKILKLYILSWLFLHNQVSHAASHAHERDGGSYEHASQLSDYPVPNPPQTFSSEQPIALAVDIHKNIVNGVVLPFKVFNHPLDDLSDLTLIGEIPSENLRPIALTFSADKRIAYGISLEDDRHLIAINQENGVATRLSRLVGLRSGEVIGGLAIDETNTCYVVATDDDNHDTASSLYQCDLSTGQLQWLGSQSLAPDIHDIAADCDGHLYGTDSSSGLLVSLNKTNGSAEIIGTLDTGLEEFSLFDLTYDRQNGKLYQYVLGNPSYFTALATIDTSTAELNYVDEEFTFGTLGGGIQSSCQDRVTTFSLNEAFSGSWYNPATDGQGLMVDVLPQSNLFFTAWFTFAEAGQTDQFTGAGSEEQRWLTASGELGDDSTVELTIFNTLGGVFNDPTSVDTSPVGVMTINFEDCLSAEVTYEFDDTGLQGSFPIQRIANDHVARCESILTGGQ